MIAQKTLEQRVAYRIARAKTRVFLRDDFTDLGGYDQVGRALRKLETRGCVVRIGHGVFARAEKSVFTGRIVPVADIGSLAREALRRLHVDVRSTKAERAYAEGRSTQVPTGRVVAVKGRVSRKFGYGGQAVSFERTR